jgi:hypothetical protein
MRSGHFCPEEAGIAMGKVTSGIGFNEVRAFLPGRVFQG